MRRGGTTKSEFLSAALTRSRLSLTALSGNPTMVQLGNPMVASSSTMTSDASMPSTAADRTLACTRRAYGTSWRRPSSLFGAQDGDGVSARGCARGDIRRDERDDRE